MIALAQAGARQALHQTVEVGDQRAAESATVGGYQLQHLVDGSRQFRVLGLLKAFGKTQQAQVGFAKFSEAWGRPFLSLQTLPNFKNLSGLMSNALGEVVL